MIGWAAILPQMLASLGAIFALAGVGRCGARALATLYIPLDQPLASWSVVYCIRHGRCSPIIMGNAFAAFPVMTAADRPAAHRAQVRRAIPPSWASIGMLSGFCGTLVTPMAANFNIVPAALSSICPTGTP
jgi:uncharacterized membrane protein